MNAENIFSLPEALKSDYRLISCLKAGEEGATLLCASLKTGKKLIIKLARGESGVFLIENEFKRLKQLEAAGGCERFNFPTAIDFTRLENNEFGVALIRTYLEGRSVYELVDAENGVPFMDEAKTLEIAKQLLGALDFLHSLTPPVIHRDIKPQNVIVSENGECGLIDFGISRVTNENAGGDTLIAGTRLTAPPEQFGYRQTDARSDLYSLGVLMRYCVSGEYGEAGDKAFSPRFKKIVQKATRFDPSERYPSAKSMLRDVERALKPENKRAKALIAIAALLCALILLAIGIITLDKSKPVTFTEPLIEQAVRHALNKPTGELTREDLNRVKGLHIFGRQIYDSEDEIWFLGEHLFWYDDEVRESGLWAQRGDIKSLSDLKLLPNLSELCLYSQNISNISALGTLKLERLGIGYNPIADFGPISSIKTLKYLNLSCTSPESLDFLINLNNLDTLVLSGCNLDSLEALPKLPALKEINLFDVYADFEPLIQAEGLEALTLNKLNWRILDVLKQMKLKRLTVTHSNGVPIAALEALNELEELFYYSDDNYALPSTPLNLPKLKWLDIKNVTIPSLSCLSGLTSLETLMIYASNVQSYEGLNDLKALKTICLTPEQKAALENEYPGSGLRLVAE